MFIKRSCSQQLGTHPSQCQYEFAVVDRNERLKTIGLTGKADKERMAPWKAEIKLNRFKEA